MSQCLHPIPLNWRRFIQHDTVTPVSDVNFLEDYYIQKGHILAPCGKCYTCRKKRVSVWTVRFIHEQQTNYPDLPALFYTLTYSDENNIDKSLDITHVQKYLKRVRQVLSRKYNYVRPIKYLLVGEYGFKSFRKHWHILVLGIPDKYKWIMVDEWKYGFVGFRFADSNGVRYALKYSFKQHFIDPKEYESLGLRRPLFSCSKGFGLDFITQPTNYERMLELRYFIDGTHIYPIPRYYKRKLVELGFLHWTCFDPSLFDSYLIEKLIETLRICNAPSYVINIFSSSDVFTSSLSSNFLGYCGKYLDNLNDKYYNTFISNFNEKI